MFDFFWSKQNEVGTVGGDGLSRLMEGAEGRSASVNRCEDRISISLPDLMMT